MHNFLVCCKWEENPLWMQSPNGIPDSGFKQEVNGCDASPDSPGTDLTSDEKHAIAIIEVECIQTLLEQVVLTLHHFSVASKNH